MTEFWVRAGLFVLCLLCGYAMACVFQYLDVQEHENGHQAIYAARGVDSTTSVSLNGQGIAYGYTKVTDTNRAWSQEGQLAQDLNEVVGYNTIRWFFGITWALWSILFLQFFRYVEGKA